MIGETTVVLILMILIWERNLILVKSSKNFSEGDLEEEDFAEGEDLVEEDSEEDSEEDLVDFLLSLMMIMMMISSGRLVGLVPSTVGLGSSHSLPLSPLVSGAVGATARGTSPQQVCLPLQMSMEKQ